MMKYNLDPTWEVLTSDNTIIKTKDFDLKWEKPGKVKEFSVLIGDSKYSVDLTNGSFNICGQVIEGIKGTFGDYSLVVFKRNYVNLGNSDKKVVIYFGYKTKEKELLFKIDIGFAER